MVAFYTTLLMYIFSRRAAENVAVDYVESALTLGAKRKDVFWSVYVPATVPELIGAFRIALAGAWGLEAIAELLGAQQGTGFLIFFFTQTYSIQKIMAIVVILGLTAIFFDRLTMAGARMIVRWTDAGRTL
jgi:ABC-type nitrate/sulfonate/bicarbonate transport system permease component